jgi:pyridoxal phosphate enzyme (YggS family)
MAQHWRFFTMSPLTAREIELARTLKEVNEEIHHTCISISRPRNEIVLIAVSKGHEFSSIRSAYHFGQRDFGESYAQEMAKKRNLALAENLEGIRWHFIGAIQSNKLKVIRDADMVHSLGSFKHAKLLNDIAYKTIDVFLQINLDNNKMRQGFLLPEMLNDIRRIAQLKKLTLKGLMTILPQDPIRTPNFWYGQMLDIKESILQQGILDHVLLSMGMSDDFKEAIRYGSNFLRIGTKIFGARTQ